MAFNYNAHIQTDVKKIARQLKGLPKELQKREVKRLYRKAAKPLIKAARANVKDGDHKPYKRFNATYHSGNLRKSIKVLPLRKIKNAIMVAPRVVRKASGDYGKGNRVNAWYAHMVEYGTIKFSGQRYMTRAVNSTRTQVQKIITQGATKIINQYAIRRGLR